LEADAFFIGEREDVDREGKGDVLLSEGLEGGERGEDAEGAIVFAGVDDGVVVRAEEERGGAGIGAGEDASEGAIGSVAGLEAEVVHPGEEEVGGLAAGGGEEGAGEMTGVVGESGEGLEADDGGGQGHGGSTAAIGAVGPGGTDEGDVIGLTGLDLEVNGNDVEEGARDVLGAEVVADVKEELGGARGHGRAFEERGVAAAGGVGGGIGEEGGVAEELDADAGAGFA
jgi:hypothetical protein